MTAPCRLCGSEPIPFYTVEGIPTSSCVLHENRSEAVDQERGDLTLAVCPNCGFIQNQSFDRAAVDYLAPYEESQGSSATFRAFTERTIRSLIDRYSLEGGAVLEIGCGKGEWLADICRIGNMTGIGIDPGYVPGRVPPEDEVRFTVTNDYFEQASHLTGDLIACRHTLEHVPDVAEFATLLANSSARTPGSVIFIEVPDTQRILDEGAFWDVYYEHCAYFTEISLGNLATTLNLSIRDLRIEYEGQYLILEASPGAGSRPMFDPTSVVHAAHTFATRAESEIARWRMRGQAANPERTVLWGATSKTVAFLAATGLEPRAVVDINPTKAGTFLPGSGLPIIAPRQLPQVDPDLVIAMNPIYVDEIGADLKRLGVGATLVALGAP